MAGGPQGSGVDSGTNIFARACCYGGLHVYGKREYHSNIKGLHSYFQVRVSPKEIQADVDRVDLLAAFDAETVVRHIWEVSPGGGIIVNAETLETKIDEIKTLTSDFKADFQKTLENRGVKVETLDDLLKAAKKENNIKVYAIPYTDVLREVAEEIHEEKLSRLTRMINVLTLGVSLALVNYDREPVDRAIKTIFGEKNKIVQKYNEKLNEIVKQHEETINKIDAVWKDVYAKVLKDYRDMEKKLNLKDEEISKLKTRLETIELANKIKNNHNLPVDTAKVKEEKPVVIEVKDEKPKERKNVFIKIWLWLCKPVLKI